MSNLNSDDQKNTRKIKRIGIMLTLLIHGLVIGALAYTYAWVPPDPPIPKKGMSIDLGQDFHKAKKGKKTQKNEVKKAALKPSEQSQIIEQKTLLTQTEESVALQKEKEAEALKSDKNEVKPKEELKATKEKAIAETKTEAIENEGKDLGDGDEDESDYADAGKKTGEVKGTAKDGSKGANGVSLDLPGWVWQREPVVNDPTFDSGIITLELTIDKYGNVVSSQVIDHSIDILATGYYQQELERSKFKPLKKGQRFSGYTKGRVTFTKSVD